MPLVNYQFDATYHNGDDEAAYRFWYCKKYHMEDKGQQYVKGHMDFDFVLWRSKALQFIHQNLGYCSYKGHQKHKEYEAAEGKRKGSYALFLEEKEKQNRMANKTAKIENNFTKKFEETYGANYEELAETDKEFLDQEVNRKQKNSLQNYMQQIDRGMDRNVIDEQDDDKWTDEEKQAWEEYQGKERVADAKYAASVAQLRYSVGVERHYPEETSITEAHFTGLTFGGTQNEQKRRLRPVYTPLNPRFVSYYFKPQFVALVRKFKNKFIPVPAGSSRDPSSSVTNIGIIKNFEKFSFPFHVTHT